MHPRLIEIGSITIYSYGFMLAVAILVASWLSGKELNRLQAEGRIGRIKPSKRARQRGSKETTPSELIGTITVIAAVVGVAGSKLFHILENLDDFARDPVGMVFSTGGLTFYGGLICAGVAIAWYTRRRGIKIGLMADALAPGLMLAYGIGRIGCHLAGDGDWGIQSNLENKPGWLPDWLWAETYPNNILGATLPGDGVYPTSIYEFVACTLLFAILWSLRRHPYRAGWLFSLYLVMNGIERFLIEKIRVNNEFEVLTVQVTQAEVISSLIFLAGVVGLVYTSRRRSASEKKPVAAAGAA